MSLSVNYNPSVLTAQRNLNNAQNALAVSLERMSTGYKVNSAADDAAGLYVATNLNTQIRGLKQAQKNAKDGLSYINTASSAISNMTDILHRLRELSLQGANSVYDGKARQAMQAEADSLTAQLYQIKNGTNFNGKTVFGETEINIYSFSENLLEDINQTTTSILDVSEFTRISEEEAAAQGYQIIKTAEDLNKIRNNLSNKYILMNDIDLSSFSNWNPVGDEINGFKGVFEGNGYTVKNLKINRPDEEFTGLFGKTDTGSKISNTIIKNANIIGKFETGALAGESNGEIDRCSSSGYINAKGTVGGLVGKNTGHIINSYSTANVEAENDAGGFVGYALGKIENCYAQGNVNGVTDIGGFAGYLDGDIKECYASGKARGSDIVGGFIGYCYLGNIIDSYSAGGAHGTENIGGFAGYVKYGNVQRCYSNASVKGDVNAGGFAGWQTGTVSSSFWDKNTSGKNNACGSEISPSDITGMQSSDFSVKSNFTNKGWSDIIWNFSTPYPTLNTSPAPIPPEPPKPPEEGGEIRLQVGANADFFENSLTFDTRFFLDSFFSDMMTTQGCLETLDKIDSLTKNISSKNSELGAIQNRLESIVQNQSIQIENFTGAKSAIIDADIAEESAKYVKYQILQQTTSSLLVQAKSSYGSVIVALIGQ